MTETQTVDLAAWLTRIWDEEERLAREALAPDWSGSKTFYDTEGAQQDSWGVWLFHIHPASVLARIAADRKILERSVKMIKLGEGSDPTGCWEMISNFGWGTLYDLASPHKGREGWQEAWGHE